MTNRSLAYCYCLCVLPFVSLADFIFMCLGLCSRVCLSQDWPSVTSSLQWRPLCHAQRSRTARGVSCPVHCIRGPDVRFGFVPDPSQDRVPMVRVQIATAGAICTTTENHSAKIERYMLSSATFNARNGCVTKFCVIIAITVIQLLHMRQYLLASDLLQYTRSLSFCFSWMIVVGCQYPLSVCPIRFMCLPILLFRPQQFSKFLHLYDTNCVMICPAHFVHSSNPVDQSFYISLFSWSISLIRRPTALHSLIWVCMQTRVSTDIISVLLSVSSDQCSIFLSVVLFFHLLYFFFSNL